MALGVTAVAPTASTTNASSYASASFTPATGDLLVVFVIATGTSTGGSTMTNSAGTTMRLARGDSAANTIFGAIFIGTAGATASAQTVTWTAAGGSPTGAIIFPFRISGASRFGLQAIFQSATQGVAAAATPTIGLGATAVSGNACLACVGNQTNPATLTPPTGWTEDSDTGYATPTTGGEVAHNIAFASGTVTYGGTTATAGNCLYIELTIPTEKTDTETGAGVDAGESIAATLSDPDTGAGVDAGESIAAALTDTETAAGADAGEAIAATLSDTDTATGVDTGSIVAGVSDAETGAATDAGEQVAAGLNDGDVGVAVDAGESLAVALTDADTGTAVDAGESIDTGSGPPPPPPPTPPQPGGRGPGSLLPSRARDDDEILLLI